MNGMTFTLAATGGGWADFILTVMVVLVAIIMTGFILLQEGKGGGLTALGGTKAAGVEGVTNPIRRATGWLAGIMFVLLIVLGIMHKPEPTTDLGEDKSAAAPAESATENAPTNAPIVVTPPAPAPAPAAPAAAPATDASKAPALKAGEAPKTDAPKVDAPKTEAPKPDAPKTDAPKTDAPAPEAPKTDAPKEAPKADAPKPDAAAPTPAVPPGK